MKRHARGFTILELLIFVLIVIALIAVPEFQKYQTRSKTAEAVQNVARIADGARAYYLSERANKQGELLEKQFPSTIGPTPYKYACYGKQSVAHQPEQWRGSEHFGHESWQSLQFSPSKPFRDIYTFESRGKGPAAMFSARAEGDLDCDEHISMFEHSADVDQNGRVDIRPIYRESELE